MGTLEMIDRPNEVVKVGVIAEVGKESGGRLSRAALPLRSPPGNYQFASRGTPESGSEA